jgi:hypothetical protein
MHSTPTKNSTSQRSIRSSSSPGVAFTKRYMDAEMPLLSKVRNSAIVVKKKKVEKFLGRGCKMGSADVLLL